MNKHTTSIPNDFSVESVLLSGNNRITVGINDVTEIVYHTPLGEGDKHFVDIVCDDKRIYRTFQIEELTWIENEGEFL